MGSFKKEGHQRDELRVQKHNQTTIREAQIGFVFLITTSTVIWG